jgi:UDP-glucose 4-epimerase
MKNLNILITGGAGFIGSHLAQRLSADNSVTSLDNYFTGSTKNHVPGVTYITGSTKDIFNIPDFNSWIPDVIFHLGEYSRVEQSFDDMDKVLEFNKDGTHQVLEFARKHKCKLIYAGSSTKYGDQGDNANASPYAWSKSSNTQLVKNYGEWYGLDYAITYFYNVYGPREISTGTYATLIAKYHQKMLNGEKLTVTSPGTQTRNFTYVGDTIDALVLIGEHGHGDEYGIGAPEDYSVLEVAKMFGGEIEMTPMKAGNRMTAPVVSDKTRALGWSPKQKLADYIQKLNSNI